ncbi:MULTISPECIES: protein kinase family protein [Streptomyces]|uniref:serine/threonine protein kinase n=1 Tax=Streptomyces sp. H-KF8 TaxID=1727216 RepID=UPI0007ECC3F1|nr:serine/threonine protein kinase [Streptomyces sp. H-KF8]OBQ50640.1 serine/threonine protein kinase [Streptomyces sp. H-KF8]
MTGAESGTRLSACPYTALTRLDARDSVADTSAHCAPMARFIARSTDGERIVLLSRPLAAVPPQRFLAEAEFSRYLLGPWILPVVDMAAPGTEAWAAHAYLPALPLPAVPALHGGPLPERTVRALAVVLAETLAVLHGQNVMHAGVSPAAILIAADGPRLTCFGAVRAAAADGVPRHGTPGLDAGSLPPEQAAGGRPRPLGDVYALGATPAYAATGYTAPERDELPRSPRSLAGRGLSGDPARRPSLAGMIHALVDDSGSPSPTGSGPVTRAEALLGPGRLPPRGIAAIAHQSASVPAADVATAA